MSAREVLELMVRMDPEQMTVWSPAEVRDALDAYAAEVRLEDAARLLDERRHHNGAIFCDGLKHAAGLLKKWAAHPSAAPTPDDSETAILRGLLRAVECAARRGDLAAVRRALADHARDTNTRKDVRP